VEAPVDFVVERYVVEDPLRVRDVKEFQDELLCPISAVEKAAGHG
jgi:hypothetical protein